MLRIFFCMCNKSLKQDPIGRTERYPSINHRLIFVAGEEGLQLNLWPINQFLLVKLQYVGFVADFIQMFGLQPKLVTNQSLSHRGC